MNNIPTMMLTTGFSTDQNGALDEIVMPKVVTTCNAPRKVTFEGQTLNWVPSTIAALQEFESTEITALSTALFKDFTTLNRVTFLKLTSITAPASNSSGVFYGCTSLTTVNMPSLKTIDDAYDRVYSGTFYGCTSLNEINCPELVTINCRSYMGGPFWGCTGLINITLPKISTIGTTETNTGTFGNCSGLQSVQLGSSGHPVNKISPETFKNCTQAGLTITVYSSGGASLTGQPWGATNATIVYEEA